ncbi:hypothetical protein NLJ89_g6323 [Agrocybe chaxingu]|uniref:Protein F37C4.5 n=1 Tax=Agrocybe chaxingu TaxID=84603 RepID=A0A9W8JZH2_9AGAR|nr:hypothetical protein NLJ89_g6323 [Agrocybe chaxingu]
MASVITVQAAEHPIKSVTVFKSSKAEVVRTFSLSFSKGQNKVLIRGLPSTIDTDSVRVSGLGEARLFDVVCTVGSSKAASYASDSSSEIIRTLIVRKLALESERATREQESQLLLKYAQTLSGEHVTPTQMGQFLESYVERERNSLNARAELSEKIVELNRQIEAEQHKTSSKQGTANGQVDIVIAADEDTNAELKLTYIVSGAQWKPIYELHATTENGKPSSCVTLHYRARVKQSTGEDWTNAALTLSTIASDTIVRRIPQLRTITMRPKAPFTLFGQAPAFGRPMNVNVAQSGPRFGASAAPFVH